MRDLVNLPDGILEKILLYLPYDEIARQRLVCHKFDETCRALLNKGFASVERYHAQCLKNVKAQLPRRESERRMHPMFRHCEILTAVETRLSMLSMTFMRYVDIKLSCFIPGKVIDEIFRVLRHVMTCNTQLRAHELLQELRDISSMAMEHFDEKVVPRLKQQLAAVTSQSIRNVSIAAAANNLAALTHTAPMRPVPTEKANLAIVKDFCKVSSRSKHNKKSVEWLKRTVRHLQLKLKRHGVNLTRQNARLREQAQKLREQDTVIAELKRHMQEWDHVLGELKRERLNSSDNVSKSEASNSGGKKTGSTSSNTNTSSIITKLKAEGSVEAESTDNERETKGKHKRVCSDAAVASNDGEVTRAKRLCRMHKVSENK